MIGMRKNLNPRLSLLLPHPTLDPTIHTLMPFPGITYSEITVQDCVLCKLAAKLLNDKLNLSTCSGVKCLSKISIALSVRGTAHSKGLVLRLNYANSDCSKQALFRIKCTLLNTTVTLVQSLGCRLQTCTSAIGFVKVFQKICRSLIQNAMSSLLQVMSDQIFELAAGDRDHRRWDWLPCGFKNFLWKRLTVTSDPTTDPEILDSECPIESKSRHDSHVRNMQLAALGRRLSLICDYERESRSRTWFRLVSVRMSLWSSWERFLLGKYWIALDGFVYCNSFMSTVLRVIRPVVIASSLLLRRETLETTSVKIVQTPEYVTLTVGHLSGIKAQYRSN